jgi:hypothetical protein
MDLGPLIAPGPTPEEMIAARIANHTITDENGRIDLTMVDDVACRIRGGAGSDYPVVEKRGYAARPVVVPRGGDASVTVTFSAPGGKLR